MQRYAFNGLIHAIKAFPEGLALTTFFAVFGFVIAVMKDVPDVVGDRQFGIKSFSVRAGADAMFR